MEINKEWYAICKDCDTEKYPEDLHDWLCIDCFWCDNYWNSCYEDTLN